jgi:DNA modification methylase
MENREIVYKNVAELIPYARNSRTHDKDQVSQIVASIKEFGFTNPVLIDEEGLIIAGHGRVQAAQKLNLKTVPTICLDYLTEAQKKAYVIADNRLALNAGWDFDMLKVELNDLNDLEFDVSLLGFDDKEINDILADPTEGLVDEDSTPDLVEDPITVEGDIWLLGNHRLMCGDSTSIDAVDKLMDGNKADMMFTDPPYNVAFNGRSGKFDVIKNDNLEESEFNNFIDSFISIVKTLDLNTYYICCNWAFYGILQLKLKPKSCIVWAKNVFGLGKGYRHQHEFILFDGFIDATITNESDLWNIAKDSKYKHPTQKPVALSERAITNSSKPKNKVLDLFGGSGSTLLACEKLDRSAYLMELDPKYCDVIIQRWQEFTGQNAVHLDSNKTYNELINDINDG